MQPLSAPRRDTPRPAARGPGPSRLTYRAYRLWKLGWVRRAVLTLPPLGALGLVGWAVATNPETTERIAGWHALAMERLSARPEFSIRGVEVDGASEELTRRIEQVVELAAPRSSLTLNVAALQAEIAALGPVKSAHVALAPTGILRVTAVERRPELLWRDATGKLWLVDREGVVVGAAATRVGYPELPIVLGDGAPAAAAEGLALVRAVPDLKARLRALVRVGARRWDVVLTRDVRILLPETGAVAALTRVAAWHFAEELLDRDIAAVDMRLPERPTVRMTDEAARTYRVRRAATGPGEDT